MENENKDLVISEETDNRPEVAAETSTQTPADNAAAAEVAEVAEVSSDEKTEKAGKEKKAKKAKAEKMPMTKKKKKTIIIASIIAAVVLAGALIPLIIILSPKTLASAYRNYFKVGVALDITGENADEYTFRYEDDLIKEFSSITAENEMKWIFTEPTTKGEFTFEKGDYIVKKAKELGMVVRGHALVWHESTPGYVTQDAKNENRNLAKALVLDDIREHVTQTVTHFSKVGGDKVVYCWDVVNEAISDSSNPSDVYRTSDLYNAAGEDFIFEAFRAARAANPNIKLYYNDYNLNQPVKRAKAIQMIKKMQSLGVPIDGVGEQAHYNIRDFDVEEFRQMIADFRELGLDVQITELDLSIYESSEEKYDYLTPELSALQAEVYAKIFEICRENKDIIKGVTLWGLADDHTWLTNRKGNIRVDYPLLFDEFLDKKDAYNAVVDFNKKYEIDPEKADDETFNVYEGSGDFHVGKWYAGDIATTGLMVSDATVDGEDVTKVHYYKIKDYTEVVTSITGDLSKFNYLNLTLKGSKELPLMVQMNYYIGDGEANDKVIGEEPFDIDTTKKTYSIKIPDMKKSYLRLLSDIWIFPEPGDTKDADNKSLSGDFYIYDVWFSETAPQNVDKEIAPNASGSGVSEAKKKAGKYTWYNETSWTRIKMTATADGMRIATGQAADWSYVSVQLDNFELDHNKLKITFIDKDDTVEYFRFRLRGSPKGMTDDGVNTYMTYYDEDLVDFVFDPAFKTGAYTKQAGYPDSITYDAATGTYELVYEIGAEIAKINRKGGIDLDGYGLRLVILPETVGVSFSKTADSIDYAAKIVYPSFYSDTEKVGQKVQVDKKFDFIVSAVGTYKE